MTVNEKIANPTKFFQTPNEINNDETLSHSDKVKLLENWLDDIISKNIAEEENMISAGKITPDFTRDIQNMLNHFKSNAE